MKNIKSLIIIVALSVLAFTGCFRPPEVPDIFEVKPNETAWLIPLDGSSKDSQVKFNSVGFLNEKKIPTKRVSINKVWRQTGYSWQWWAGGMDSRVKIDHSGPLARHESMDTG